MNPNKLVPTIARIAPPLLLAVVVGVAIKSLFFGEENKTETAQANTPKNVPIIPPIYVPPLPTIPAPAPIMSVPISENLPPSAVPQKRRIVLREDLMWVFQNGARSLYRINAVAELQKLGFGKTAAYEALSPVGKFASWLKITPDGIISWNFEKA